MTHRYVLDARARGPHFPGIGRYVGSLAPALAAQLAEGESLDLLEMPNAEPLPLPEGAPVTRVSVRASPFSPRQQAALPRVLRGAAAYHSPYYLMPYRPGVPTVLTVYDLIPMLFPGLVSARARLLFRTAMRLAQRAAAAVICISEATRRDLLAHFPGLDPARVEAIPLAPAPQFRPQPEAEVRRVRAAYGLPPEFALYVGINKPHKNLPRLLEAWGTLPAAPPLVLAGPWDPRYPEAKAAAARLPPGRARFLGPVPEADLPGLYAACRVFVFPSLYEGFGLPVVEALACGAAVACANTASLPEAAGEAAVLFDPHDPAAITAGVQAALALPPDPAPRLAQAASFSWERTAAATLAAYRRLAAGPFPRGSFGLPAP